MTLGYALAYATGITPWERAGDTDPDGLDRLFGREEVDHGGPGRMLDLGCGSGAHTVTLAGRGWKATGVDQIDAALHRARRRAESHQVSADFDWQVIDSEPAVTTGMPRPLRHAAPTWYRLRCHR
jgi:SAM-dependent methyltransferase